MGTTLDDVKSFMLWWTRVYPIDRWWREKHKVPFNSQQHRAMSFIDMKLEYEEDLLYMRDDLRKRKHDIYDPGTGKWIKRRKPKRMSQRAIDDAFDSIDVKDIRKTDDGRIII